MSHHARNRATQEKRGIFGRLQNGEKGLKRVKRVNLEFHQLQASPGKLQVRKTLKSIGKNKGFYEHMDAEHIKAIRLAEKQAKVQK